MALSAVAISAGSASSNARGSAPALMRIPSPSYSTASAGGGAAAGGACAARAIGSNFHEHLASFINLPLEELPSDAVSVPTWKGSFTSGGTVYPYTMVGTDPARGSATTDVPVVIVPLSLDFAGNGCVLERAGMAADIEASPLFSATPLLTDETQYLDDFQRASFWSTVAGASPGYHLLLDPSDVPAVTVHVPASQGLTAFDPSTGRVEGIVDAKWLFLRTGELINSLHISPRALAVFVPYNTFVTDQNPNDCLAPAGCSAFIGFHSALPSNAKPHAINTFAMASFLDFGTALPPQYDTSATVLSHEILEWADDPFAHGASVRGQLVSFANTAPTWSSPHWAGGSICSSDLEVADPLQSDVLLGAEPTGSSTIYVLSDAAFLPWFARESPSSGVYGLYDEGGVFATYSTAC